MGRYENNLALKFWLISIDEKTTIATVIPKPMAAIIEPVFLDFLKNICINAIKMKSGQYLQRNSHRPRLRIPILLRNKVIPSDRKKNIAKMLTGELVCGNLLLLWLFGFCLNFICLSYNTIAHLLIIYILCYNLL